MQLNKKNNKGKKRNINPIIFPKDVFDTLSQSNISYIILSGFQRKWSEKSNIEIDLWVHTLSMQKFLVEIKKLGFYQRKKPANAYGHTFYVLWGQFGVIILDVQFRLFFYNFPINLWVPKFNIDCIMNNAVNENGIRRPDNFMCILLYAANCCWLKRGRIKNKHINNLKFYLRKYGKNLKGKEMSFIKSLEYIICTSKKNSLSRNIEPLLYPYFQKKRNVFLMFRKWLLRFKMIGLGTSILFIGTDGVGKTTLMEGIRENIPFKTTKMYMGMSLDWWLFPIIGKVYNLCNWKWARIFGIPIIYWYVLLPMELLMRRIYGCRSGRSQVILIDRFPGYPFIRGGLLCSIYKLILPRPDLLVLLTGDPNIIASRKPKEINPTNSKKDLTKWALVSEKVNAKKVLTIDTTMSELDVCKDIVITFLRENPFLMSKQLQPIKVDKE